MSKDLQKEIGVMIILMFGVGHLDGILDNRVVAHKEGLCRQLGAGFVVAEG